MIRRLFVPAPVALLLMLIAAAAVAAHDGHDHTTLAGQQELRGRVVETHGDVLSGSPIGRTFFLEMTDGARLRLDAGIARLTPGERVRVRGSREGNTFVVADGQDGITSEGSMSIAAIGQPTNRRVAVIAFNFSNNTAQPWTNAAIETRFFGASNSVNAYFKDASYGQMTFSGDVFGWYTIAATDATCSATSTWATQAKNVATAAGANLGGYDHVAFVFPKSSACSWAGLAYMPGRESWNNGTLSVRVAGHELAHNLGIHHAASLSCTSNGTRVTLSSSCTETEYGDPFDIMGASSRLTNNWHRWRLKYFTSDEVTTVTSAVPGQYTVGVVSHTTSVHKIVRVARPDGKYYYLEFRQPFGAFDNFAAGDPAVNGVLIRIAPDKTNARPQLLDGTPATTSFKDAAFGAGQTFSDTANGITIAVTSVTTSGAVVMVGFGDDTSAPSAPGAVSATAAESTISLAWGAATDNVGVAGYRVRRDGVQVAQQVTRTFTDGGLTDGGLTPGTTYLYEVVAYDTAGNVGPAASLNVATVAPAEPGPGAPGSLTATVGGPTSIVLAWSAASSDDPVTGYRVTRNGASIGTAATLTHADGGLKPARSYTYTVAAQDATGAIGPAVSITATTAADTTPPSKVKRLTITALGSRRVRLTWDAATDNVKVKGYRIYRDGRYRKTVSELRTRVKSSRGAHTFKVRAINTSGNIGRAVGWSIRVR